MAHRNGAYAQLLHHRQQEPEQAPEAADNTIVLAPEPDQDTLAGRATARKSMAARSSMAAGRKSMAAVRKSMAPGRKDVRKSMAPGRQSMAPAARKSVFPGGVSSKPCRPCLQLDMHAMPLLRHHSAKASAG